MMFTALVKTMPLNISGPAGPIAFSKKRIKRCALELYNSTGILVNGQRFSDKSMAINQFDAPPTFSGIKRMHLLGWSLTADVEITQTTPYFMQISSIGLEVAT